MLKNISKLGRTLARAEQKEISGSGLKRNCLSNCAGQAHGTPCWSPDCSCPGMCVSGGQCAMY